MSGSATDGHETRTATVYRTGRQQGMACDDDSDKSQISDKDGGSPKFWDVRPSPHSAHL